MYVCMPVSMYMQTYVWIFSRLARIMKAMYTNTYMYACLCRLYTFYVCLYVCMILRMYICLFVYMYVLYCIVSIHLYSASCSAHQSEALPVRETQREESSLERTKRGTWLSS